MKKALIIVLVLAVLGAIGLYYSKGVPTAAPAAISENASVNTAPKRQNDKGTVAVATAGAITLDVAGNSQKTYAVSSSTSVVKEVSLPVSRLSKGAYVSVILDPNSKKLVSISVVPDKAMLPISTDQTWFITGTVEKTSGTTVTVKDAAGASRDFAVQDGASLVMEDKIDASSLKPGDKVSLSWIVGPDGAPQAENVFVPMP